MVFSINKRPFSFKNGPLKKGFSYDRISFNVTLLFIHEPLKENMYFAILNGYVGGDKGKVFFVISFHASLGTFYASLQEVRVIPGLIDLLMGWMNELR